RIWFASQNNEFCYWENNSIHHNAQLSKLYSTTVPTWDHMRKIYFDSSDNLWISSVTGIYCSPAKQNHTTLIKEKEIKDCTVSIKIIDDTLSMDLFERFKLIDTINNTYLSFSLGYNRNSSVHYQQIVFPISNINVPFHIPTSTYTQKKEVCYSFSNMMFIATKEGVKIKTLESEIIKIYSDKENNLWVGLKKDGVLYFKNGDLDAKPIRFLKGCSVSDIAEDHEKGIWMTSLEKGVFYVPSTSVFVYPELDFLNDPISGIENINGKIIVCTFGKSICTATSQHIVINKELSELQKKYYRLYSIKQLDDTVYVCCTSKTLLFTKELKSMKDLVQGNHLIARYVISSDKNTLWVQNGGTGLGKINKQKGTNELYSSSFRSTCALATKKGIFIGGKNGLYKFKDGQYFRLDSIDPILKSQIAAMITDKNGCLWLATEGDGLLRLKDNKVTQFNTQNALLSNTCTSLTIDHFNTIWVGTNKGLNCLQQSETTGEWKIKKFNTANGLNSNEITKLYAFNDSLWVGTMTGLSFINIPEIMKPLVSSPVYITSITVNNAESNPATTVFNYNERNFKIAYNGLTYKDKSHVYSYRLAGLDTTWQTTRSNELLFNNLAPGNYSFQVKVANINDKWSSQAATYSFTIKKPFWLTWWFILLEIIALGLIVYITILWRTSSIQKKEAEKLRINKLLSEYQMKALTAQMNPHFIFNAINSIQNFIIQNHSTLAYDYLIKFSKLIRLVLNNSKDNEISIQQELEMLALYIELEQLRFENSFEYHLQVSPDIDIDSLMIPGLLLQPYIENAIWHGLMPLKNKKGAISLTIKNEKDCLKITISDNGVGRKASDQIKKKIVHRSHKSVGMELTGKRIELFGQENKFSIQIIDNYDDNGIATGTTVEIILPMVEMY
ncbi:MAG TPA: histidine kinase, partial [Bacteroidia bacterium]|nr:histidine kinase [Bacteroidia bacterium]